MLTSIKTIQFSREQKQWKSIWKKAANDDKYALTCTRFGTKMTNSMRNVLRMENEQKNSFEIWAHSNGSFQIDFVGLPVAWNLNCQIVFQLDKRAIIDAYCNWQIQLVAPWAKSLLVFRPMMTSHSIDFFLKFNRIIFKIGQKPLLIKTILNLLSDASKLEKWTGCT